MKNLLLLILCIPVFAIANTDIVGHWKSIDDETGKAKALIEIQENNGIYTGKIIKSLLPESERSEALCSKCTDDRKDQAKIGMEIIRGVIRKKDNLWKGGKILDPNKGKEYKVKMKLQENAKVLKVRGYIGSPMLGRTQFWQRADAQKEVE